MKLLLHFFAGALALAIALPAARAQVAGSRDPAFNPNVPSLADDIDPYSVRATAVQPDGKIVIAGNLGPVGGQPRGGLARLHPNGTVESTATFSGYNPVGGGISSGSGTYFGSPANSGPGADGNDYDHDGSVNVLEFATHRDPTRAGGATGVLSINGGSGIPLPARHGGGAR